MSVFQRFLNIDWLSRMLESVRSEINKENWRNCQVLKGTHHFEWGARRSEARGALNVMNERKCTCTKEKRENERHELCNTKLWGQWQWGYAKNAVTKTDWRTATATTESSRTVQEITNNIHLNDSTTHFTAFFV